MNKMVYVWLAVKTLFCTCQSDHRVNDFKKVRSQYKISKIGKLPGIVNESSGVAQGDRPGTFWTLNDSGGKPELYLVGPDHKLITTKTVPNAANQDWEDLTKDDDGHLYVGDFGNNSAPRKKWDVYKFDPKTSETEKITFSYSSKTAPNPDPKMPSFDCEAFFYYKNNLYLFSKNWGKDKTVKLYRLPAKAGDYTLDPIDNVRIDAQVTSADISPDDKTFALMTYGKILLFEVSPDGINFSKPAGCLRFSKKQTEALMFLNNKDLLITNEQGDIYKVTYR